jgi:hypothetical protein
MSEWRQSPISEHDLNVFLSHTVGRLPVRSDRDLTVGVEHEMFLNVGAEPCSHDDSQALFETLIARGWQVAEVANMGGGPYVASLSAHYDPSTQLKYEHHPNLIEVAFNFRDSLLDLESLVSRTLAELAEAAHTVGVTISSSPFCCVGPGHPATRSETPLANALRAYRRELLTRQGRAVTPDLDNFSAVIAATQVQIGGLEWWSSPTLIAALYSLESALLGCSYLCCEMSEPPEHAAAKRWIGYFETLRGCPLVGFPDLEDWTRASWISALTRTPTMNGTTFESTGDFFISVRDLQIIRPRVFGTLEFRGDPAQGSVAGIIAMAAIRLACCIGARRGYSAHGSFQEHRNLWWSHVTRQSPSLPRTEAVDLITRSHSWLQEREKGEERFLDPLVQAIRHVAPAPARAVLTG